MAEKTPHPVTLNIAARPAIRDVDFEKMSLTFDPALGQITSLALDGREVLHRAHWVGTPAAHLAGAPIESALCGSFFAAPFGASDVIDGPIHGPCANSAWRLDTRAQAADAATMRLELLEPVMGAHVRMALRLAANAPVLYQRHIITGGQGALTFAHHPMLHIAESAHIATSRKRAILTPETPLEPAHALAYPARSASLDAVAARDRGTLDLTHYAPVPEGEDGTEDFLTMVEMRSVARIGWTAVTRAAEGDIVIFLKDPRLCPVTMLWMSNGGRKYAPWDGRHRGVLGIEDGRAAGAEGHRAAMSDNAIAREGVPTALPLSPATTHEIRHATVVLPRPEGFEGVADVRLAGGRLVVTGTQGTEIGIPFDQGFFA
ncbi:hypothetical protein [Celeribacter sp.]|uniref:hypothetical protein n=1 Tax=Celeribacter sp. TaxID=1890673 RepID=UPI003A95BFB8